ncbi:MAG: glycosyltransferase [Chthoniobacterales bacterium]
MSAPEVAASSLPRLLFVTGSTSGIEEYFYLSGVLPWVDGLRHHFQVEVVAAAQDVIPAAERFAPDLVLFFGAKYKLLYDGPAHNFQTLLGIPIAALTLMDGHSPAKQPFFEHAWRLGVEAVFTIDTGMREMAGDFAEQVFYCPWFVNEDMCRDFGEKKVIPVALIGDGFVSTGKDWRYPWRRNVAARLREAFPVFSSPRPTRGYSHRMVGEAYARMLNRSSIALACGASRHIFMKKDLEIPASRSCLLTEPNDTLIHLGFRDMENCVFAEPDNVVEKCRHLLDHPDALQKITDRGRAFVLERHSAKARRVIADWLELRNQKKPGERIIQPDVMNRLELVPAESARTSILLSSHAPFTVAMREASEAWRRDDFATCQTAATAATDLLSFTIEPLLLLAYAALKKGDATEALQPLRTIILRCIQWGAANPDPLVWAAYLLGLHLSGNTAQSQSLSETFPEVRHPALDAVRQAIRGGESTETPLHATPSAVLPPWHNTDELQSFLAAAYQTRP